jgi:UDP-2,3-diacylglucosamine hydrolase
MSFAIISDIHVRSQKDERYQMLLDFLNHDRVITSKYIVFLGDIFEFMVGAYEEYFIEFRRFFELLQIKITTEGKRVFFFEGNHDFLFKPLLEKVFTKTQLNKISYIKRNLTLEIGNKKIYLGHGDEVDILNNDYQKYRKIIRSPFANFLVNEFVSYQNACRIKNKLSHQSKEYQKDFNEIKERSKYRAYAADILKKGFDEIVIGHSHIFENENHYYNCGFFPHEKKFFILSESNIETVNI